MLSQDAVSMLWQGKHASVKLQGAGRPWRIVKHGWCRGRPARREAINELIRRLRSLPLRSGSTMRLTGSCPARPGSVPKACCMNAGDTSRPSRTTNMRPLSSRYAPLGDSASADSGTVAGCTILVQGRALESLVKAWYARQRHPKIMPAVGARDTPVGAEVMQRIKGGVQQLEQQLRGGRAHVQPYGHALIRGHISLAAPHSRRLQEAWRSEDSTVRKAGIMAFIALLGTCPAAIGAGSAILAGR